MLAPLMAMAGLAVPVLPEGIVGGDPVEPGSHPAVVAVLASGDSCTGTLLGPDMVITAAHCLWDPTLRPELLYVAVGDAVGERFLPVIDYGFHPEACDPFVEEGCGPYDVHDYGWIRLGEPAPVDAAALPVVITDEDLHHRMVRPGAEVELVGFGEDDDGVIGIKRRVFTSLVALSASGEDLRAGGNGRDSCLGDSGGPALVPLEDDRMALVGVLSRGKECGEGGLYGAPLPALCWIRDDSGVDVVPPGCESCDCVDLTPHDEEGCGCTAPAGRPFDGLGWLVLVGLRRRRGHVPGS